MKASVHQRQNQEESEMSFILEQYPLGRELYICARKKTSDSQWTPGKSAFKAALLVRLCSVALSEYILQIVATHTQIVFIVIR